MPREVKRDIERRVCLGSVELREGDKDKGTAGTLVGYAAVFNSLSEDLGGFREIIRPGAFDRALKEKQDVLARAEHMSTMLLGRTSAGTCRLEVDTHGLRYEIDVPDTQPGRDTVTLVKRGDVRQSSFAFYVPDYERGEKWEVTADGVLLRELLDVDLVDVAPVAMPAYQATQVSARTLEHAKAEKRDEDSDEAGDAEPSAPAEQVPATPEPVPPAADEPAQPAAEATVAEAQAQMGRNRNALKLAAS